MVDITAQGFFSWAVLDSQDRIVRYSLEKEPNLILNQGLDGIAVRSWAESFKVCVIGTGQATPSKTQTGLVSETKRSQLYLDSDDACSASVVSNKFLLRRTFVFPSEVSPITYKEGGFSHLASPGNNLFSRIALPSILVSTNERLIIQYEILLKILPITPVNFNNPVLGASSSGVLQFQKVGLCGINSLGQTEYFDAGLGCNEPSVLAKGFLSQNSTAPAIFTSAVDRSGTVFERDLASSVYVNGTYTREKVMTINRAEARNNWRSCGVGSVAGNSYIDTGLVYVFSSNLAKQLGKLKLNFRYRWSSLSRDTHTTLLYWLDEEKAFLKQNPIILYFKLRD